MKTPPLNVLRSYTVFPKPITPPELDKQQILIDIKEMLFVPTLWLDPIPLTKDSGHPSILCCNIPLYSCT